MTTASARKTAYEKAFDSLEPNPFRTAAFSGSIAILAINKLLGGSWHGFIVNGFLMCLVAFLLPARQPRNFFRLKVLSAFRKARNFSQRTQLLYFIALIVIVVTAQYLAGGLAQGRGFNFFLLPVFLTALLFGLRTALIVVPISVVVTYYCIVPPHYSFYLYSATRFADIIIFFYESLLAAVIAVIFYESSALANERNPENRRLTS